MVAKKPHIYNIGEEINGLKIVEQIRSKRGKGYIVQSLMYKEAPTYEIREGNIVKGDGDAYASGKRVFEGNSLYSFKRIRKNIIDIEHSKQIPPYHNKPVLFKCDNNDCEYTKKISPNKLLTRGFKCNKCSKNLPFGQLAFGQYSDYFKLGYESEVILPNMEGRRVDFVKFDNRNNIINFIEIQGRQHSDVKHRWYEDAHEQDIAKRKWAKENNVLMIEIDMRVSSWDYFKKQINSCEYLPNINDEDEKSLLKLMEKNSKYPTKEIIELYTIEKESLAAIGKRFKICYGTVRNILEKNNILLRGSKIELPEKEIIELYTVSRLSLSKISEIFKVSEGVIKDRLLKNDIKLREGGNSIKLNLPVKEIVKMYRDGKSIGVIANKYNCSDTPIRRILNENKVETRKLQYSEKDLPSRDVVNMYVVEGLSTIQISKKYNVGVRAVSKRLEDNGVKLRPVGTNQFNKQYNNI